MAEGTELEVDGTKVTVSNLGKVFYPATGFTKKDVIDYYIRISEHLLPHLKDRPITLKRYPNGVEGEFFYEKRCPSSRPKWVRTTKVPKADGSDINYCVIDSLPALVWAANMADLELHTFLHKMNKTSRPTAIAFDLDPGPPADILQCCEVALRLRTVFDTLKLRSFAKTSGSKGMQIYVPLNSAVHYDQTKTFAHNLSILMEREFPQLVVSKMLKSLRAGKVFMDWSQNDDTKTTVNVYSLRAKQKPTVSTPLDWSEVESAHKRKKAALLAFEPKDVLRRTAKMGDLFQEVLAVKQKLPKLDLPAEAT